MNDTVGGCVFNHNYDAHTRTNKFQIIHEDVRDKKFEMEQWRLSWVRVGGTMYPQQSK